MHLLAFTEKKYLDNIKNKAMYMKKAKRNQDVENRDWAKLNFLNDHVIPLYLEQSQSGLQSKIARSNDETIA